MIHQITGHAASAFRKSAQNEIECDHAASAMTRGDE
jgi:hypothetical protein